MRRNHVIDPTFFYDAIDEFAFEYDIYVKTSETVNEQGVQVSGFTNKKIRGSLQIRDKQQNTSKEHTTTKVEYDFYCKSLYRIKEGDFIHYDDVWLYCDRVHPYNEYGVREAHLVAVELTDYRDLAEYVKYLEGEKIV